jgi:hypothetical protein
MKKILSVSLALVLIAGLMPMGALSASPSGVTVLVPPTLEYAYILGMPGGVGVATKGEWPDDKRGAIDRTGKPVIPVIYESLCRFAEGLFVAVDEGKSGILDIAGNVILPLEYDSIYPTWNNAVAPVRKDGKYGLVDRTGKIVLEPTYGDIESRNGTVFFTQDGKRGILDNAGNVLIPADYDEVEYFSHRNTGFVLHLDGYQGYADLAGNIIVEPDTYHLISGRMVDGRMWVRRYDDATGFYTSGFVDAAGQIVIPLTEGWVSDFCGGRALVATEDYRAQIIDTSGNVVVEAFEYVDVYVGTGFGFVNGLAAVIRDDGKWGLINTSGETVVPFIYDGIYRMYACEEDLSSGEVWIVIVEDDHREGILDSNGKVVVPAEYSCVYPLTGGLFRAMNNNPRREGIYSLKGGQILPVEYDDTVTCDTIGAELIIAAKGDMNGVFDREGNVIIPMTDNYVEFFWDSVDTIYIYMYATDLHEVTGVYDSTGKLLFQGQYEIVEPAGGEVFFVRENGKWGILQIESSATVGVTVSGSTPGAVINLSADTIALPASFTVAAYSTDGGKKWKRGELPNAARFPRLLNKGMTLHVTSDFDRKGKKPTADAETITFPEIAARPKRNADKLRPSYGETHWVLAKKGSTAAVFAGLEYAPSANGRTPDDGNWIPMPQDGIAVTDSRDTYLVRTAPTVTRAASVAWRVRTAAFGKAPNLKVKNDEITVNAGMYVKLPDGTVTLHREKKKIPAVTGMEIWRAANGKKPASEVQTLS